MVMGMLRRIDAGVSTATSASSRASSAGRRLEEPRDGGMGHRILRALTSCELKRGMRTNAYARVLDERAHQVALASTPEGAQRGGANLDRPGLAQPHRVGTPLLLVDARDDVEGFEEDLLRVVIQNQRRDQASSPGLLEQLHGGDDTPRLRAG